MQHRYIECEAITTIAWKRDCAHHQKLGWSKTKWHTHNRGQLIYAEDGVMRLYTEQQIYYIPSFHMAWIPEGVKHLVMTESTNLIFRTLYLDHTGLYDEFYSQVSVFHTPALLKQMIEYTSRWPLIQAPNEEEQSFLNAIKLILPQQTQERISICIPATEHVLLREIIEYVKENIEELPKVELLAKKFAISSRTMNRLFIKELKMPYAQFLKLYRIIKALELLSRGIPSVSEVAYRVGYSSIASFSNTFLEITGKRPQYFTNKQTEAV